MAIVRPFRALRPVPEKAQQVASVPYDVVTTEEAKILAGDNPLSFLHVIRPEIDLPANTNPYSSEVYRTARSNLSDLIRRGVLIQDDERCFYIYRISTGGHQQTGLGCCCSVSEYDADKIRKHEHTRREKEDDRTRHMLTLMAHAGPVLMTFRPMERIRHLLERGASGTPLYDLTAEDGVRHTVWRQPDTADIIRAFRDLPLLYIADGHHRAAGASRVRETLGGQKTGSASPAAVEGEQEEYNFFLAVLFPSDQLRILAYNRYVSDLNGMSEDLFLEKIRERFSVTATEDPVPPGRRQFCMYLGGRWRRLDPVDGIAPAGSDPVSSLDLSVFHEVLLRPVLGIVDQKKDVRIDFIGGGDSTRKLEQLVDQNGGAAFSFYPVSIDELLAVADAHLFMPPKSTWFSPKLRSGLLIHRF